MSCINHAYTIVMYHFGCHIIVTMDQQSREKGNQTRQELSYNFKFKNALQSQSSKKAMSCIKHAHIIVMHYIGCHKLKTMVINTSFASSKVTTKVLKMCFQFNSGSFTPSSGVLIQQKRKNQNK